MSGTRTKDTPRRKYSKRQPHTPRRNYRRKTKKLPPSPAWGYSFPLQRYFRSWHINPGFIALGLGVCLGLLFAWFSAVNLFTSLSPGPFDLGITASQGSGSYSVVGPPTIDAQFINRVLAAYHSPASGKGQALYDDGVKYNIDPAYALAFFMEESTFGTQGVARVTHSLGNIRASGTEPSYQGYRLYATWEEGFEDWYRLIAQQYVETWNLKTVDQIIPVYAPTSDHNDEKAYIQNVKRAIDTWHKGIILV